MALDPKTNMEEESPKSIFQKNKLARQSANARIGSKQDRTASVADLGLDKLSKYEDYIDLSKVNLIRQDVNTMRAKEQSGIAQGFNAVVGGVTSGLATAVEDLSYIADFDNHLKALNGQDTWEKNWLAESMGKLKQGIDETLPIYRESVDTFDWDDPAFYWSSFKGIIDSAVGFGLPGGIIAKGVSSGMKAARLTKLIELATKGSSAAVNVGEALGAGIIQNYAEGKIMGIETYENTYDNLIKKGVSEEEAKKYAGQAADEMLLNNRAMILTDAFSLYGLTKGLKGAQRSILKEKGFRNRVKDFGSSVVAPNADNVVLQGAKEAGEEIVQNVIQMEAQYKAEKAAGINVSDRPENTLDRLIGFATSDQALLEGMMGFFGGGPQRILSEITSGNMTKSAKEQYKQRYDSQQEAMSENATFVKEIIKSDSERFKERDEARAEGQDIIADGIEAHIVDNTIIKNMVMGTTEDLETKARSIIQDKESSPEQKKSAENVLSRIESLEKEYIRHSNKANLNRILTNRSIYDLNLKFSEAIQKEVNDKFQELQNTVDNVIAPNFKKTIKGDDGITTDFTYNLRSIDTNPYNKKDNPSAFNQYNNFIGRVNKEKSVEELKDLSKSLDKIVSKLNDIQIEYNELLSDKAQKQYVKEATEQAEKVTKANKVRKETVPVKKDTDKPIPGKTYESNIGELRTVIEELADGRIVVAKPGSKAGKAISKEEFNKYFLKDGKLTARENEEEVNNTAKEESKKNNNIDTKSKTEIKTPSEKIVSSASTTYQKGLDDVEPNNSTDKISNKTKDSYSSINTLALAWVSYNNTEVEGGSEEDSKLLEDKNNNFVGTQVKITINDEAHNKYNSLSNNEAKQNYITELVNSEAIEVKFLDDSGIKMWMHLPSFIPESRKPGYALEMGNLRMNMLEKILKSPSKSIYSVITSKGPGSIQKATEQKQSVKEVLGEEDINKIVLLNRGGDSNLYIGYDEDTKEFINDDELGLSNNPSATKGAIFVKVPMANGKPFPMRLNVETLSEAEANLIVDIYLGIWDKDVELHNGTLLSESNLDLTDTLVEQLINTLPNKKDSTVAELLKALVYEGDGTADKKYPLYRQKNMMKFGDNISTMSNLKSNNNGDRDKFVKWLSTEKIRNVNFKKLNDNNYKNYLLDNNLLTSNALYNENGVVFAQPTFTISNDFKEEFIEKESIIPKTIIPKDVEMHHTISEADLQAMLEAHSTVKDDNIAEEIKAVKNEMNHSIKVTSEKLDRVLDDISQSELGNKLTAEMKVKFKSSYNKMKDILGEEKALDTSKAALLNELKNCK